MTIERAPTVFTFISERPRFRQIKQKRIESSGGASEKRYGVGQCSIMLLNSWTAIFQGF
jgi:hypothetical protein